jgi:uncharacterized protein
MEDRNGSLQIVQDLYAAFAQGNAEAALALLHEGITWELIGPSAIPYFGRYCGRTEVREFFSRLLETQHFEHFAPEEFIVDDGTVVALGREWGWTKSTGKKFETRWAHVFECRDQRIVAFREYIDTAPLLEALRT